MKNITKFFCIVLLHVSIFGCASSPNTDMESETTTSTNIKPPDKFEQYENQYIGDPNAVVEGEDIYRERCESCHGEGGNGEGPLAKSLDPKPGSLIHGELRDPYLFWRISEGGMMDPFNSVMPAWETI